MLDEVHWSDWFKLIASAALAILVSTVCVSVFARYILNLPITGADETIGLIMAVMITAALPAATFSRLHITVKIIDQVAGIRTLKWINLLANIITVVGFTVLGVVLAREGLAQIRYEQLSDSLQVPLGPFAFVLAVSSLISAVWTAARLFGKARLRETVNDSEL